MLDNLLKVSEKAFEMLILQLRSCTKNQAIPENMAAKPPTNPYELQWWPMFGVNVEFVSYPKSSN